MSHLLTQSTFSRKAIALSQDEAIVDESIKRQRLGTGLDDVDEADLEAEREMEAERNLPQPQQDVPPPDGGDEAGSAADAAAAASGEQGEQFECLICMEQKPVATAAVVCADGNCEPCCANANRAYMCGSCAFGTICQESAECPSCRTPASTLMHVGTSRHRPVRSTLRRDENQMAIDDLLGGGAAEMAPRSRL